MRLNVSLVYGLFFIILGTSILVMANRFQRRIAGKQVEELSDDDKRRFQSLRAAARIAKPLAALGVFFLLWGLGELVFGLSPE